MKILPAIGIGIVLGVLGANPVPAQYNAAEVAKDRCDQQLAYDISQKAGEPCPTRASTTVARR